MMKTPPITTATLSFMLILIMVSNAVSAASLQRAGLEVFADGEAHFEAVLSLEETEASANLPLLAPKEHVYNILAVDNAGSPLDYELGDKNITVYALGAGTITIEYDTDYLTTKESGVWTLSFEAPFEMDIILPEKSTIIYINAAPSSLTVEDGAIRLKISPGFWEISYDVEVSAYKPPEEEKQTQTGWTFPLQWLIAVGAALAAAVLFIVIIFLRRRTGNVTLRYEEEEVLRFIKNRGGRALEAELREAFPDIPRTSMWRLVKRLERRGKVKVKKIGLQNVVEAT
jgi:uncharacterized membrane protein